MSFDLPSGGNPFQEKYQSVCKQNRSYEDFLCICQFGNECGYYAVFDGHGGGNSHGDALDTKHVAIYLKEYLHRHLWLALNGTNYQDKYKIKKAIVECFHEVDRFLYQNGGLYGSTACIVITTPKNIIYINLGDSQAVKIENNAIVFSTINHNASTEIERIVSVGGYLDGGRLNGIYLPSRSFGDYDCKKIHGEYSSVGPMNTTPDVYIKEKKQGLIVLGSDGLFDGLPSSKDLLKIVVESPSEELATRLVDFTRVRNGNDDTTCIVISL